VPTSDDTFNVLELFFAIKNDELSKKSEYLKSKKDKKEIGYLIGDVKIHREQQFRE
jgi:hypothetical protein